MELLLRRVHERLLQLDLQVQGQDDDAEGWGQEGFEGVDDVEEMLVELKRLTQDDEEHANLVFNVFLVVLMIDGKMSKQELKLLRRVLGEGMLVNKKWDLFYDDDEDEEVFMVNGDRGKIQEQFFKHAELIVCQAGDQLHAGYPLELEIHVEVVLPDLKKHHDQLMGRKPAPLHDETSSSALPMDALLMSDAEKAKFEKEEQGRDNERQTREMNQVIDQVTKLVAW